MAGRRRDSLDVREMVRRIRMGEGDRQIARDMAASRKTVARYRAWATREGLLEGDLPAAFLIEAKLRVHEDAVVVPKQVSSVEPYRAVVEALLKSKVEAKTIFQRLKTEHGYLGSYGSVLRFVHSISPPDLRTTVRVETAAGEEAQVDFGYAGRIPDETWTPRRAWIFVMTLSWSRHQYAEIVYDQKVDTWLGLHERAFQSFCGAPERVVLDNLKAGIVRASLHDQEVQRAYRELAEHYGFLVSPCRPRTPEHKGKVESGVRYVKRSFLAGRTFTSIEEANRELARWVADTAGTRDHGTTHERPLDRFAEERKSLKALPAGIFERPVWKKSAVHRDCHVVLEQAYYSVPHRLVSQEVWVKATARTIDIFAGYELVATHSRAARAGERRTHRDHLPPEKIGGLEMEPARLRKEAAAIGERTEALVTRLLEDRTIDRRRAARSILSLEKRHGARRLEAACRRALLCEETSYAALKRILERGLDSAPLPPEVVDPAGIVPKTARFARLAESA